jgi:hypothetical protein
VPRWCTGGRYRLAEGRPQQLVERQPALRLLRPDCGSLTSHVCAVPGSRAALGRPGGPGFRARHDARSDGPPLTYGLGFENIEDHDVVGYCRASSVTLRVLQKRCWTASKPSSSPPNTRSSHRRQNRPELDVTPRRRSPRKRQTKESAATDVKLDASAVRTGHPVRSDGRSPSASENSSTAIRVSPGLRLAGWDPPVRPRVRVRRPG